MFTVWSDNGHGTMHGAAQTFADSQCWNGTCDNQTAKCSLNTNDCSKLDTSTCPWIAGCSLKDGPTTYACEGSFDTCTSLDAAKCATNTVCTLWADNKCTSDVSKRKSCKNLPEAVCTSYATCNRKGTVSQTCGGTVQAPKNDVDCNILATQLKNFWFSITRTPGYDENIDCPSDCVVTDPRCGDDVCTVEEAGCSIDKSECGQINDTAKCTSVAWCYLSTTTSSACEGTLNCSVFSEPVCGKFGCSRDPTKGCIDTYDNGKIKSSCTSLWWDICETAKMYNAGCSTKITTTENCAGTMEMIIDENSCNTVNNIGQGFGFTATRSDAYDEEVSCTEDCEVVAVCGNGVVEWDEICDSGINNSDTDVAACKTTCDGYVSAKPVCKWMATNNMCNKISLADPAKECGNLYSMMMNALCIYDSKTSACVEWPQCNPCGNGTKEWGETCDDGANNGKAGYCTTKCDGTVPAYSCGNGIVEWTEKCDDGTDNGNVWYCNKTCDGLIPNPCGNGKIEWVEICDNGDSNGKAGMCNTGCTGYIAADNTCGNGKCESISACTLTTTECSKISNMTTCPTVAGCSTKENTTSTCVGEFSCTAINNKDACKKFSCNRTSDNKCVDVYKDWKKASGLCSSFSELCKTLANLGLCSQSTKTTTLCDGTITTPANDVNCLILDSIGKSFGIFAKRETTYMETTDTCPADCETPITPTCEWDIKDVWWCNELSSNVGLKVYYNHKDANGNSYYVQCVYDSTVKKYIKGATCEAPALCGNGVKDGTEICDEGINNGKKAWACNTSCTWYLPMTSCWNFIIEAGEVCDNGTLLNGKPGQCNLSCDGWISYNGYCGDGVCGAYCKISSSASTCTNFNTSEATKALCPTLWCMLQYTDTSTCKGTVSCKDITAEKFWNSKEAAHKYCDIAWCTRDNQTNACWLLATQKAPSCSDLGKKIGLTTNTAEYCPRITGCILYTGNIETKCIGTTPPRADKLDQNQCATIKGTWTSESISSCNTDCKPSCTPTSTTITHADGSLSNRKCNELSLSECTQYYNPEGGNNCILKKGSDGKEYCIEDSYTCTTCGNGICDTKETESSCSQDCLTEQDWPKVLYSSYPTDDGKLIKWPVQASVYLPPSKWCKIINNNNEWSYNFRYNGYYVFQVMCPWFDKPWDLIAKVYWLNSDTITAVNAKDMISSSGWSVIYYENKDKFIDTISTESSMVAAAKKAVYEQTLITTLPNAATQSDLTQVITTNKNISFENDSNVYQKISLEKTMGDTTKSTQKVKLTIPDAVTLYIDESGKKTEFSWVFIAPTAVTWKVLTTASQEIQNLDTVIKAGTDKELIAVNSGNSTVSFEITVWTEDALWSMLDIYMSQDGTIWEYYTWALVEPCTENSGIQRGIHCTTFEVPHLTYYGITTNVSDTEHNDTWWNTWGWNGGGNGGSSSNDTISATNLCTPDRDCNNTSLIALCGACSGTIPTLPATGTTITITPENEQLIAYQYAFLHNITTMSYEKARLGDSITRGELAKMIVNFAKNVLEKKPDTKKVCAFSDNIYGSKEDKSFIIQACQLWLMGLKADWSSTNTTFNPMGIVSRAEFGTVFSRLMYGDIYNKTVHSSAPYYENHLKALQRDSIMKKIDQPENKEQRGFVMIMMMRADLQDKALTLTEQSEASNTIVKFFKNLF